MKFPSGTNIKSWKIELKKEKTPKINQYRNEKSISNKVFIDAASVAT